MKIHFEPQMNTDKKIYVIPEDADMKVGACAAMDTAPVFSNIF
jgi:hypothetical protein